MKNVISHIGQPASAPADIDFLLREVGELDAVFAVFDAYEQGTREAWPRMREGLGRGDLAEVARLAHAVKGGALNFQAEALARAARDLEFAAREGRAGDCPALLETLEQCFALFAEYMHGMRGRS